MNAGCLQETTSITGQLHLAGVSEAARLPVRKPVAGESHAWERTFTYDDIERTSQATGDRNPLHFDTEYAAKTVFKKPIVHGVALIGEISRALGMDFPGEGTVLLETANKFKKAVYPGDTVHFIATVKRMRRDILFIGVEAFVDSTLVHVMEVTVAI